MYAAATIISIPVALYSDRLGKRSPILIFFISMAIIGYIITICGSYYGHPNVVYGGVFIIVCGKFTYAIS
jgi:hypothetical protein